MKTNVKFPLMLKAAALAAAISLQGVAMAAPADGASAPAVAGQSATATPSHHARHHQAHKPMRNHRGQVAMWVPGYGPLSADAVKVLNLNESQSKLLSEAQTAQKDARKTRFEAMKAERKSQFEQLKAGKIDPHAAAKQSEADRAKAVEARTQIQAKWFAVWDSLDATQQQKVSTLLSERAAKWGEHMKHMKGMHAPKGHPMRPAPDDMPAS